MSFDTRVWSFQPDEALYVYQQLGRVLHIDNRWSPYAARPAEEVFYIPPVTCLDGTR